MQCVPCSMIRAVVTVLRRAFIRVLVRGESRYQSRENVLNSRQAGFDVCFVAGVSTF